MARTPDQSLYRLIRSLSSSEKRYFTIYSQSHYTDQKYFTLFNCIINLGESKIQEEELKKKVYKNQELKSNTFAGLKSILYDKIIACLIEYNKEKSIEISLFNYIATISILYQKGLYSDCFKVVQKALKKAKLFGNELISLRITWWKFRLQAILKNDSEFTTLMNSFDEMTQEGISSIRALNNLHKLSIKISICALNYSRRLPSNQIKELEEDVSNSLILRGPIPDQYDIAKLYWKIKTSYYLIKRDTNSRLRINLDFINKFENSISFVEHVESIQQAYYEITGASMLLGNHKEAFNSTKMLLALSKKYSFNKVDRIRAKDTFYLQGIFSYCTMGEFDKANNLLLQMKNEPFGSREIRRLSFFYIQAAVYFGLEKFDLAIEPLEFIIDQSQNSFQKEIQSSARWFILIVHFELNNFQYIDNVIRSSKRNMQKLTKISRLEQLILTNLQLIAQAPSKKLQKSLFLKFQEEVNKICLDSKINEEAENSFKIKAWLESKISGKRFSTIIKQNYIKGFSSLE